MKNRDNQLKAIRPELNLIPASGDLEQFQHQTLRPVLKFQNELLLEICRAHFEKRKNVFWSLGEKEQLTYLVQELTRDKHFKNILFGTIIGHFSLEEWHFFQQHEKMLRKRLSSLLQERFVSQLERLTARH